MCQIIKTLDYNTTKYIQTDELTKQNEMVRVVSLLCDVVCACVCDSGAVIEMLVFCV